MVAADEYDDELRRIAHYERGVAASLSPPPALPGNGGGGGGPKQASLEALNNQLDGLLSMNHTTQASNSVPPPEAKPADDMQTLLGSLLGALKTDPGAVLQSEHLQPVPPQLLEAMAQAQANGSAAAAAAAAAAEVDGGGATVHALPLSAAAAVNAQELTSVRPYASTAAPAFLPRLDDPRQLVIQEQHGLTPPPDTAGTGAGGQQQAVTVVITELEAELEVAEVPGLGQPPSPNHDGTHSRSLADDSRPFDHRVIDTWQRGGAGAGGGGAGAGAEAGAGAGAGGHPASSPPRLDHGLREEPEGEQGAGASTPPPQAVQRWNSGGGGGGSMAFGRDHDDDVDAASTEQLRDDESEEAPDHRFLEAAAAAAAMADEQGLVSSAPEDAWLEQHGLPPRGMAAAAAAAAAAAVDEPAPQGFTGMVSPPSPQQAWASRRSGGGGGGGAGAYVPPSSAGHAAGRVRILETALAAEKAARRSDAAAAATQIATLERLLQNLLLAVGPQSWDEAALRTLYASVAPAYDEAAKARRVLRCDDSTDAQLTLN
jgi:hypothetical protein